MVTLGPYGSSPRTLRVIGTRLLLDERLQNFSISQEGFRARFPGCFLELVDKVFHHFEGDTEFRFFHAAHLRAHSTLDGVLREVIL
jgi:hypothetical protein